jgi:photosystem II stability/assembly factor-like uncharacterized protein
VLVAIAVIALLTPGRKAWAQTDTWESIGPLSGRVTRVVVDPRAPATLYILVSDDLGNRASLFRTTDGGTSWRNITPSFADRLSDIAIDPLVPSTLYGVYSNAAQNSGGVARSSDGGDTWLPVNTGLSGLPSRILVDPLSTSTLYAVMSGAAWFRSVNGGETWTSVGSSPPGVTRMAIFDPRAPGRLYAATSGGVYATIDGAGSWHSIGLDSEDVFSIAVNPLAPDTLYAGTRVDGVFKSIDGGVSWNPAGLRRDDAESATEFGTILQLIVDPMNPSTLYAARGGDGVFRTTDGGETWNATGIGAEGRWTFGIAIGLQTRDTVYAATTLGLFASDDGGAGWVRLDAGFFPVSARLVLDPQNPARLFAITSAVVFRSLDGGASWDRILTPDEHPGQSFATVVLDPMRAAIVYFGVSNNTANGIGGLYRSTDGGDTLSLVTSEIGSVAIDPRTPTTLYGAGPTRVVAAFSAVSPVEKSIDDGVSWTAGPDLDASGECPYALPQRVKPGTYEFRLFANASYVRLATSQAFVVAGPHRPVVTVPPSIIRAGRQVTVHWKGLGAPTPTDWVALYAVGADDTNLAAWLYLNCADTPTDAYAHGSCRFLIPADLSPGRYEIRLFANGQFWLLATSNTFQVRKAKPSKPGRPPD